MEGEKKQVLKIGITGSIGSGKSLVCNCLRAQGFSVLDSDGKVHDLYKGNSKLRAELSKAFGEDCLTSEGVNRKFIADLIFENSHAREKLESIVYPYLTESVSEFLERPGLRSQDIPNILPSLRFVEAALLNRTPEIVNMLDEIWIVDAPEDVRLKRLVLRGLDETDAKRRMENQRGNLNGDSFKGKAVRNIENAGSKDALVRQLNSILDNIAKME